MTDLLPSRPARHANGRFGPGNPGRPRGSRNRTSRRMALALLEQFEAQGAEVFASLSGNPQLCLKLLECVLPARPGSRLGR
jgi:hypothetical protein